MTNLKTVDKNEFINFIKEKEWEHFQEIEIFDKDFYEHKEFDEEEEEIICIYKTRVFGQVSKISIFENIEIVYIEDFSFIEDEIGTFYSEYKDFYVSNFNVVDKFENKLLDDDIDKIFSEIDYSEFEKLNAVFD